VIVHSTFNGVIALKINVIVEACQKKTFFAEGTDASVTVIKRCIKNYSGTGPGFSLIKAFAHNKLAEWADV
jgi:hypothetical protein